MLPRRLLTALLATCLTCTAGAQDDVRLPDLGGSAQALLSPEEASQYGASMLHQMRALHMVLDDPLIDDYLNDVGYRLVAHSDKPKQKFTFFVVKDKQINAFAAPGGYIGVNAGLIALTRSESELAAVMAHEIGHITQHHMERAFEASKKDAPLMALVLLGAIVAGASSHGGSDYGYGNNSGDAAVGILAAGQGLIAQRQINFTRKDEIEADRIGIRTLATSGYDPDAMASFFQRMEDTLGGAGDNIPALLKTHPVTLARVADAKARARALDKLGDSKPPMLEREQWEKITAPIRFVDGPHELTAAPPGTHRLDLYPLMRERVRVLSGDPRDTVDYYARRMQQPGFDTPSNRYGYALALTLSGRGKQAVTQLRPLLQRYPASLPLRLAMADAEHHAGHRDKAMAIYAELAADSPDNRAIAMDYAQALVSDHTRASSSKAAGLLKPLLSHSDEPRIYQIYARASEGAGDNAHAAEAWANASYLSGRPFDAMEQLQRLLKRDDLDYYQRARVQADIAQLRPLLLELRKRHIDTEDRDNGERRRWTLR